MQKKILLTFFLISIVMIVTGLIWRMIDNQNASATFLSTIGFLLSLLVVGYYSTPSGTTFGKIAFAAVCILIAGIAMKFFHVAQADKVIIGALFTLAFTYAKMWMKTEKHSKKQ